MTKPTSEGFRQRNADPTDKRKRSTVSLPPTIVDDLRAFASHRGVTVSSVVEVAVGRFLAERAQKKAVR